MATSAPSASDSDEVRSANEPPNADTFENKHAMSHDDTHTHFDADPSSSAPGAPAGAMTEEDQSLISKICTKIEQLSESDRLRSQLVVLYSDTLCPILKFHTELFSEIVRVLPSILGSAGQETKTSAPLHDNPWSTQPQPNILTIIISPTSNAHVKVMLADPFQLNLVDRTRLAAIQVESSPLALRRVLLVDDSWARLQAKNSSTIIWRSTETAKEHHVHSLTHEYNRLASLLFCVAASTSQPIGTLEPLCVLNQSESEIYGIPSDIRGKAIFIVTKDREERPKAIALKTCMHWIDRLFLRSGYTLEWIQANVIPLYVELPGVPCLNPAGQRKDSAFESVRVQLPTKRPLEACTRIKVREGHGAEVLEPNVLEEVERTKIFEAHAIRRPMFEELMGNMSLDGNTLVGGMQAGNRDNKISSGGDMEDCNPFL
ncbi:hypothetical protein BGZ65_005280 [Modicella reniformis]|uniref:Uncharacterized protein n=1 Tax=Modicella reniformis TaxID=1440133 RepID=A0A9P6MLL8_9FUNG|nr:hypothetical protein BGZ65_005280 [Modicella reniformis]